MFNYEFNNFYEVLEKNAKKFPKKTAYFIDDRKISWGRVKKKVDTFARTLEFLDVKKYDKVPVLVGNSIEYIVALLGIQKIGAVPVPINTFLKEDEIAYIVNDVEAQLMVASAKFENNLKNNMGRGC
jgi:long-chain acyl-CoA synthetase